MALALNRYLCMNVIPLMTSYSHYFDDCDHHSSLLESILHTIYRLSKCRSLTKNQLDLICAFLLSFARYVVRRERGMKTSSLIQSIETSNDDTIVEKTGA